MRFVPGLIFVGCGCVFAQPEESPEIARAKAGIEKLRALVEAGAAPRACRLWSGCVCRRPRELLRHHNATAATVDAPYGVQKEDEKRPQGNELKAPFGE